MGEGICMRWVNDHMDNSWGDIDGHVVHYTVPFRDLMGVSICMQQQDPVTLIVRVGNTDYNYGIYRIARLMPQRGDNMHGNYTAMLTRTKEEHDNKDDGDLTDSTDSIDSDVHIVRAILDHKKSAAGEWTFLVDWDGDTMATWEPLDNLVHGGRINEDLWKYSKAHNLREVRKAARRLTST